MPPEFPITRKPPSIIATFPIIALMKTDHHRLPIETSSIFLVTSPSPLPVRSRLTTHHSAVLTFFFFLFFFQKGRPLSGSKINIPQGACPVFQLRSAAFVSVINTPRFNFFHFVLLWGVHEEGVETWFFHPPSFKSKTLVLVSSGKNREELTGENSPNRVKMSAPKSTC